MLRPVRAYVLASKVPAKALCRGQFAKSCPLNRFIAQFRPALTALDSPPLLSAQVAERASTIAAQALGRVDPICVGLCKQDHLPFGVAVDHVKIVCNVTTENGNITACYIGEDAEPTLDRNSISVVTNECQAGFDDLTVSFSADSGKLKVLGGS